MWAKAKSKVKKICEVIYTTKSLLYGYITNVFWTYLIGPLLKLGPGATQYKCTKTYRVNLITKQAFSEQNFWYRTKSCDFVLKIFEPTQYHHQISHICLCYLYLSKTNLSEPQWIVEETMHLQAPHTNSEHERDLEKWFWQLHHCVWLNPSIDDWVTAKVLKVFWHFLKDCTTQKIFEQ